MLHPSMTELLTKVDNRYLLVNITAKRAREIADEAELHEIKLTEKPVKLALDDIMSGRIIPIETPLRPDQDANEVPEEPEQ
ncbi:MAG: DNA-directed RNA polymerase subunit omega [Clostridia bacterium]|nr:DNA-directed RNA polymerase subunit omega [Clostridia bacterium]MDD7672825.1 DNA-directed RNA polymerase subunit omega [Clostridia bacterium]MDY2929185.1 DNA-directed RNA polymerase subunit omega [Clostridiaceae bacterium]